jgi:RimJ/RimL family protein N-acetyltransferase
MVAGPPLSGRRVRLRPVTPADHEYLYALATHPDMTFRWRYRGAAVSYDSFLRDLWGNTLVHFVVERVDGGQRIGYVQAFDAAERHGWCHFAVMLDPMLERSGWAIECLALFFNYMFTTWAFRKLYAVVLETNYDELESGSGKWFTLEGRLNEHEYYDGRYWDLIFLAVRRADWEASGPGLIAKLTGTETGEAA